jgi:hypothetical protein
MWNAPMNICSAGGPVRGPYFADVAVKAVSIALITID